MPKDIFRISIEHPISPKHPDAQKFLEMDQRMTKSSKNLADDLKARMQQILSPGHKFNVGATGTASQNFFGPVFLGSSKAGRYEWVISEGPNTKANFFIRRGFKGTKGGKHIPLEKLRVWAKAKNISLYYDTGEQDEDGERKLVKTRYVDYKATEKRRAYRRVLNRNREEMALEKLRRWLETFGSSQSHWLELHPVGKPRFDYPRYIIERNKSVILNHVKYTGNTAYDIVVKWVSGLSRRNVRTYTGGHTL